MQQFTNLYPLSKTLRFELKPQWQTLEHINQKGILLNDAHRAESYQKVKKIIDRYHKMYIDKAIVGLQLQQLDEYVLLYKIDKKTVEEKKQFEEVQKRLRKQIADQLTNHPDAAIKEMFKNIFAKELIKEDLKQFAENTEEQQLIAEFDSFTTYFGGFHENRQNMYSAEDKSTAISYRLVHQNLPKFIDNQKIFNEKILGSTLIQVFPALLQDLEPILQATAVEDFFDLSQFNETLSQKGIEQYNSLLGGYVTDDGVKKQGLNEYINLHNQTQTDKTKKIPRLKPLFKQILSDRNSISFLPDEYESDQQLLQSIQDFYHLLQVDVMEQDEHQQSLAALMGNMGSYDLSKIYVKNDLSLTDLSQKVFGSWSTIQQALDEQYKLSYTGKAKPDTTKYEEEQKKYFKNEKSFSLHQIIQALAINEQEQEVKTKLLEYFISFSSKADTNKNLIDAYKENYAALEEITQDFPADANLIQDSKGAYIGIIKAFLDGVKEIQRFVKLLAGSGEEADKEGLFYGQYDKYWELIDKVTPLYNMVRNYVTKKPYSTKKIKINFENSTLLDGWDVNKEEDNGSMIFRKDGNFYLAIMDKDNNKSFRKLKPAKEATGFQKMNYKLLPGASKMLPKVFFSAKNIEYYAPSDTINDIRNRGSHTKNGSPQKGYEKAEFNILDCRAMIDFFKRSIDKHTDWKAFDFKFSPTAEYNSIDQFYREVEAQGYKITFENYKEEDIQQLVAEGKLYFFQIYNKDFSTYSKGTPNMHTMYWRMLFDEENLKNVVYKLNGQAEIFFREASIKPENRIIHEKNKAINNKNPLSKNASTTFEYDIVKDKRYTVDKFQFHVPITMNFKAAGLNNINTLVNEHIQKNGIQHIIGIDRGERHLLYVSLIDMDGTTIKELTLNDILVDYNGQQYKTDYKEKLDKAEKDRASARLNWQAIENIKELKEGYLSQAVHIITQMMVKYNAIVVLEDLNMGFMRGRQKVEKQVYQKFEKMLIDKLNYLVDKKQTASAPAGLLQALQLSNKFESFQKMGKQSGFLYYMPAWNTSKMDPLTGFVDLLYPKYESIDATKTFINKLDGIKFNKEKNYFEFDISYKNFTAKADGTRDKWTLCSYGERIITKRDAASGKFISTEHNLTSLFKTLLDAAGMDLTQPDLRKAITAQGDAEFYKSFMYYIKLLLQMRNSITGEDTDYMLSPVQDAEGNFYDSRKNIEGQPANADANGAYNIARKGLWVVDQLKYAEDITKPKLMMTNKDWLQFAQR